MKYVYAFAILMLAFPAPAQTTHLISVYSDYFDPDTVEMLAGDSIHLVFVDEFHTFTQVDDTTWFADGTASNGGFDLGFGTANPGTDFTFSLDTPGTYYYVCIYHLGMKGIVNVSIADAVADTPALDGISLFPNPTNEQLSIQLPKATDALVTLTDTQGRTIHPSRRSSNSFYTIDLRGLSAGVYRVIIEADGKRTVLPFAKE